MGCTDPLSAEWNGATFELQAEQMYRVTGGFPRVVPSTFPGSSLPAGVSDLQYTIDLSAATAMQLSNEDAMIFKDRMLACLSPS
jgi:hypothetical protein